MSTFVAVHVNQVPPQKWRSFGPTRHRAAQIRSVAANISQVTGPLDGLSGRRCIALIDTENVTISCRNLGYELSYSRLAELLRSAAKCVSLHAVLSIDAGDKGDRAYMEAAGFQVYTRVIRYLPGGRKAANADNLFAFRAGVAISRSNAEVVLLGTGDGQLADDTVQCIKALPGQREIMTLSVAGATSTILEAKRHGSITANIEIGLDLLAPAGAAKVAS